MVRLHARRNAAALSVVGVLLLATGSHADERKEIELLKQQVEELRRSDVEKQRKLDETMELLRRIAPHVLDGEPQAAAGPEPPAPRVEPREAARREPPAPQATPAADNPRRALDDAVRALEAEAQAPTVARATEPGPVPTSEPTADARPAPGAPTRSSSAPCPVRRGSGCSSRRSTCWSRAAGRPRTTPSSGRSRAARTTRGGAASPAAGGALAVRRRRPVLRRRDPHRLLPRRRRARRGVRHDAAPALRPAAQGRLLLDGVRADQPDPSARLGVDRPAARQHADVRGRRPPLRGRAALVAPARAVLLRAVRRRAERERGREHRELPHGRAGRRVSRGEHRHAQPRRPALLRPLGDRVERGRQRGGAARLLRALRAELDGRRRAHLPLRRRLHAPLAPGALLRDWGLYTQLLWGFRHPWSAGLRLEWASGSGQSIPEGRAADPLRADRLRLSPLLQYQPTEFSRIRLQYNYDHSTALPGRDASTVWLGLELLYGAHPAHSW